MDGISEGASEGAEGSREASRTASSSTSTCSLLGDGSSPGVGGSPASRSMEPLLGDSSSKPSSGGVSLSLSLSLSSCGGVVGLSRPFPVFRSLCVLPCLPCIAWHGSRKVEYSIELHLRTYECETYHAHFIVGTIFCICHVCFLFDQNTVLRTSIAASHAVPDLAIHLPPQ